MGKGNKYFNLAINRAYPTCNGYPIWVHIDYKRQDKCYIRRIDNSVDYLEFLLKKSIQKFNFNHNSRVSTKLFALF